MWASDHSWAAPHGLGHEEELHAGGTALQATSRKFCELQATGYKLHGLVDEEERGTPSMA